VVVNTTFIRISVTVSGSVSEFTEERTQNVTDALRARLCPEDGCPGVMIQLAILPASVAIEAIISYREDDEGVAAPVEAGSGEAGSGVVTLADAILLRAEQMANATTAAALQQLSQALGETVEQVGSVIVQKHVPVEVPLPLSPPPPSPAPPMQPAAAPLVPDINSNIELLRPSSGQWQDETAGKVFFAGGMILVLLLGCFWFSRRCLALPLPFWPRAPPPTPARPMPAAARPAHSEPVCVPRPQ
jgi:hypothetical protein